MLKRIWLFFVVTLLLSLSACSDCAKPIIHLTAADSDFFYLSLRENITVDVFSPPVATRIYAYSFLSAHECFALGGESPSLLPSLHGFKPFNTLIDSNKYISYIASLEAFKLVATVGVYRGFIIQQTVDSQMLRFVSKYNIDKKCVKYSIEKGAEVAHYVIERMNADGYAATRNKPFYNFSKSRSDWEPTAPTYGNAIEPYWPLLQTFIIDSSNQFNMNMRMNFDSVRGSDFYNAASEVYRVFRADQKVDTDKLALAHFWDCNPVVNEIAGHATEIRKQNTPGGHWLGIAQIHFRINNTNPVEALRDYTILACGMSDGFMVCWEQKYRYHLIRPETFINRYIDSKWRPILECPLFPEFPSGHSVASAIAADLLVHMFKKDEPYIDSTNGYINMEPREFRSMKEAAKCAALSRFYGGIHYRYSIEQGLSLGDSVAAKVIERIKISPR